MLYIFHCPDFPEIISLVLYEALLSNNIPCQLSRDTNNHQNNIWLLFCSNFNRIKLPKKYIVYQTEPVNNRQGDYYNFLYNAIQIWDYSKRTVNFFSKVNKDVIYLPFRYSPCMEIWNDKPISTDIIGDDVLFIGYPSAYRNAIIDNLKGNNIKVNYVSNVNGADREALIRKAKINLVLYKCEEHYSYSQDVSRIFPTGSKRAFMISTTLGECPIPSIIQCPVDQLLEKILFYLNNEEARLQNIEAVYQEIKSLTMADELKTNINSNLSLMSILRKVC